MAEPRRGVGSEPWDAGLKNAVVFFTFVAFGSAYILLAKLDRQAAYVVTSVPVLLMLAYAVMVTIFRGLRLRDDQTGDNLYYMGFLFTLVSLGVSLYQFTAEKAAEEIVQNFGIAVASTIAGVALRIAFNQMRRDPIDVERTARLELADAARRVRRELDATVVEFNHFRRTVGQVLDEGFREIVTRVDDTAGRLAAGLADMATKSAAPFAQQAEQSRATLEALARQLLVGLQTTADQLATETRRLGDSSQAVSQALQTVSTDLKSMQTPAQVIAVSIAPITEELQKAIGGMRERFDAHADHIDRSLMAAASASSAAKEAVTALTGRDAQDRSARDDLVRSVAASSEAVRGATQDGARSLVEIARQFESAAGRIIASVDAAKAESAQHAALIADAYQSMGSIARILQMLVARVQTLPADTGPHHHPPLGGV